MVAARTSKKPPPDLGHVPFVELGARKIERGDEVTVEGIGRVRFRWVDRRGNLTFCDKDGGHRTVQPHRVRTIHRVGVLPQNLAKAKVRAVLAGSDVAYADMTPGQKAAYTKRMRMAS